MDAYAGFDMDATAFILATRTMTPRQIGRLMAQAEAALRDGDLRCLRSLPFVGRLYRPRPRRRSVSPAMRRAVLARDGAACKRCGSSADIQIDHIVPIAWGGAHDVSDMQPLCGACNREKGPRPNAPRPTEAPCAS